MSTPTPAPREHEDATTTRQGGPPRLLVLCQLFYPELVSTGQTLTELCEVLAELGVEVRVVCGPPTVLKKEGETPRRMEHHGIQIRRVWGTRFPKLSLPGKLCNQLTYACSAFVALLCDRSRAPILVLTNPPFLAVACALLRKLGIGKPFIYLIFDVYPEVPAELGLIKKEGFVFKLWNAFNRFCFREASKIIVIGRCMREIIERKMAPGALDGKMETIHVWADDQLIGAGAGDANPYVEKWGLAGKFVVSYSGNMGRYHDMETIMEAAKRLQGCEELVFLFIGEGQKKAWMKEFAEREGLTNCQFHPYVPREDLPYSLGLADLGLVSLSDGQEGLCVPSKTYGLLAASIPVVALMSPHAEIARVLQEEDCGVSVAQGDAEVLKRTILELKNDPERLAGMRRKARAAIDEKYNLRAAATAYRDIIVDLQLPRSA